MVQVLETGQCDIVEYAVKRLHTRTGWHKLGSNAVYRAFSRSGTKSGTEDSGVFVASQREYSTGVV